MLKGLEEKKRTRSNRRDMKITLNTFFLVAGSTGAAIVRLWREREGCSVARVRAKRIEQSSQIVRSKRAFRIMNEEDSSGRVCRELGM
jgi:hypothetical protein